MSPNLPVVYMQQELVAQEKALHQLQGGYPPGNVEGSDEAIPYTRNFDLLVTHMQCGLVLMKKHPIKCRGTMAQGRWKMMLTCL